MACNKATLLLNQKPVVFCRQELPFPAEPNCDRYIPSGFLYRRENEHQTSTNTPLEAKTVWMPVLALLQVLEVPAPTAALPTPLMEQKQGSHCPVALGKWKAR